MASVTGKDLVTAVSILSAALVTATVIIVTRADGAVLGAFLAYLGGVGTGRALVK